MIHPIHFIIELVSKHFGVSVEEIRGKCRKRELVIPRQVAQYFYKKYVDVDYTTVGAEFFRDRSTIYHSVKLYQDVISKDKRSVCETLEEILISKYGRVNFLREEVQNTSLSRYAIYRIKEKQKWFNQLVIR